MTQAASPSSPPSVPSFIRKALQKCGFDDAQIDLCARYEALIRQWQKAINLVAPSTVPHIMERHILDSAQVWPILRDLSEKENLELRLVDLGSGGGLPGIVLAIAGAHVTMIESDTRKSIFLRETARELGLQNVTVINARIEAVPQDQKEALKAPFVTARALSALDRLVEWSVPYLMDNGHMVFMKGAEVDQEIAALPADFQSKIIKYQSITESQAQIVVL